jgi:hypothetical protein
MNAMGHNESAVRLAALAGDAQIALDKVARGEADAMDGWMAYGAALNEGRALHTSENGVEDDRGFGGWINDNDLHQLGGDKAVHDLERAAAMWAAANADQLAEARAACNARTLRGQHKQWKAIEAEREKAALDAEKAERRKEAAARAKAADEEAAEQKAKEEKARKDAAEATDEAEATAALARAAEAAKAADAAEAAATIEKQASEPDPQEPPADPYGYAKLTEEALLDTANGLRADLEDERARRKKADAEVKALKSKVADLTANDTGKTIARLTKTIEHKGSELFRESEKLAAEKRKNYALNKRVEELQQMGIAL